jgi:hypothetical protein
MNPYNTGWLDEAIKANSERIAYKIAIDELHQALTEAKQMLIDLGMQEDSVGLAGINNVLKKYETN